ncbi:MBL fold metallo-hydrolase [Gleimia sp. 6138-11-ORH1]|uniref:MBL fold metallo-hydrolase n=1 Tax=Gleimia sp. 6138-11-ORH1 TaxID=2973937 RepID=UPI0021690A33|nr:MBL fold metallo-hydrolase [Gleimia sp. 6138-11-ORH1]MCS4484404.1 MBL fold metallo-hydrolase [Gleimia sp. 6138-11-ORH1]
MRIHSIVAEMFAENTFVITPPGSNQALIVDPGVGVTQKVNEYLTQNQLEAHAVLLTHGHPDHVWEAANFNTRVWIPRPDLYRLKDPLTHLPLGIEFPTPWQPPAEVCEIPSGTFQPVPKLNMLMIPAPGHTEGSAIFLFELPAHTNLETNLESDWLAETFTATQPFALAGDVIFMQGVGRTDLPGGDETQMRHSLRTLANSIDPATILLPGHGYITQWGFEKVNNAYVKRAMRLG